MAVDSVVGLTSKDVNVSSENGVPCNCGPDRRSRLIASATCQIGPSSRCISRTGILRRKTINPAIYGVCNRVTSDCPREVGEATEGQDLACRLAEDVPFAQVEDKSDCIVVQVPFVIAIKACQNVETLQTYGEVLARIMV